MNNQHASKKPRTKSVWIVSALCLIGLGLYLLLPVSRVQALGCSGNLYYDKQEIYELAGIAPGGFRWIPSVVYRNKLKKAPFIEEASIFKNGRLLGFKITEIPVLGYDQRDEELSLLLLDGSWHPVDKHKEQRVKASWPLLKNLTKKQVQSLVSAFQNGPETLVSQLLPKIAQIESWPQSYDENMLRFILSDGTMLYAGLDALPMLSNYPGLQVHLQQEPACLIFDADSHAAVQMACSYLSMSSKERDAQRRHMLEQLEKDRQLLEQKEQKPGDSDSHQQETQEESSQESDSAQENSSPNPNSPQSKPEENLQEEDTDQNSPDQTQKRMEADDWQACEFDWLLYSPSSDLYQDIYDGSQYRWNESLQAFDLYAA